MAALTAFALYVAVACASLFALAAPTTAYADDEIYYYLSFDPRIIDYDGSIFALPGEKVVLSPTLVNMNDGTEVEGATFKWTCAAALKAKTTDKKATISKAPGVGKYKITIKAFDADGNKIHQEKVKIVVKKKVSTKMKLLVEGKSVSSVKKGKTMMLSFDGANWGWCTNHNKRFYTIVVKSLSTGKSVTVQNGKRLPKNSILKQPEGGIGGTTYPLFYGEFKAKGKFKVTGTFYHNGKKISTASKTITVK